MSYDVTVYGARTVDADELAQLAASVGGLAVEMISDHEARVLRGRRAAYSFTIFGPDPVDAEDLPHAVIPHVLDATTSWQLVVEGSDPAEIPHAVRFAKQLAKAALGVAYDEQTDEALAATKQRAVPKPDGGLVRLLQLQWYQPVESPSGAAIWLEVAKKLLPEALPRRYGSYEPLRNRFEERGEKAFLDAYERGSVMFNCASLPCREGGLGKVPYGGLLMDSLTVVADTLDDARWRNTVRQLFVDYARRRGTTLAVGEVLRNHRIANVGAKGQVYRGEHSDALRGADGLLGLPPRPTWWTWFGTDYLPLVRDHLPDGHVTVYAEGVLYETAPQPADRGALSTVDDPVPAALRAKPIPTEPGVVKIPSVTAADVRLV